jgi:DNA-directed RNA polymerase specialized sigma24 family protein
MSGDFYGDLAASLRLGTPEAIAWLLDAMGTRLYDYLCLMLGDRDVATHALADALIVGRGHIGRLREPRLPAWLFALARIEHKRRRRAAGARAMPDVLGALTALARLDEEHENATWAELSYLAMARMEPQEREILVLDAMVPVLSAADIADILGAGRANAADLHRRAVRRLRRETALLGFDPGVSAAGLMGAMSGQLLGRVPRERVMYMCVDPDLAARRRRIQERTGPFRPDGFPVADAYVPGAVRGARHRRAPRPIRLAFPGGGPRSQRARLINR